MHNEERLPVRAFPVVGISQRLGHPDDHVERNVPRQAGSFGLTARRP